MMPFNLPVSRRVWLAPVSVTCAVALLVSFSCAAQKPAPSLGPGDYVTEGGWGNLNLKTGSNGALLFSIDSVGGNAHSCSLQGELRRGKARLPGMDDNEPCEVTMLPTAGGIEVRSATSGSCRYYCGMRAEFDGVYLQPAPACAAKAVAAARSSFQQLYNAKQFARARARLEPLLTDCIRTLNWLELGRIRNDLAVTLHKLGELAGCRAVLQPLAGDAAASDAQLRETYPPTDADNYLPIVRAARTNTKRCREN